MVGFTVCNKLFPNHFMYIYQNYPLIIIVTPATDAEPYCAATSWTQLPSGFPPENQGVTRWSAGCVAGEEGRARKRATLHTPKFVAAPDRGHQSV